MGSCTSSRRAKTITSPQLLSSASTKSALLRPDLYKLRETFELSEARMHKRLRECYRAVLGQEVGKVTDLNLKFTPLDLEGARHLATVLPFYNSLLSLRLWKTRIGPTGCPLLSQALSSLPQLRLLSIEDNAIGPTGISALSQGLRSIPGLEEFFLHANSLQPEGGRALATLIPYLPRLRNLTVDENSIEDQAAIQLIRVLCEGVEELRLLGLGYNRLTERTAREMMGRLHKMKQLRKVTFRGAAISEGLKLELSSSLPDISLDF